MARFSLRRCFILFTLGIYIFLILFQSTAPSFAQSPRSKARLIITFTGIRVRKGILNVDLYNNAAGWLGDDDKYIAHRTVNIPDVTSQNAVEVVFNDLEPGIYAVAAFQDTNSNGKLDTNFLGIPTEPNGTSNNPRPRFRAPRFDEAKFSVNPDEVKAITIQLRR